MLSESKQVKEYCDLAMSAYFHDEADMKKDKVTPVSANMSIEKRKAHSEKASAMRKAHSEKASAMRKAHIEKRESMRKASMEKYKANMKKRQDNIEKRESREMNRTGK